MLNVAICDDKVEQRNMNKEFLKKLEMNTNRSFYTQCFSSGNALLEYYINQAGSPFHIIIMGIKMSGLNGIEIAKKIRQIPDRDVKIIFLTRYPNYIMDSFDVQASQYLLKPVSYDLFAKKMLVICDNICSSDKRYILIKSNGEEIAVKYEDIISIVNTKCCPKGYLEFTTLDHQYMVRGALRNFTDKLTDHFISVHRSTIVNMNHIEKFTSTSIYMCNGSVVPLGRSKVKQFRNTYIEFLIEK
ncbi:LytR/AlgR family response regulator transcription factor [Paenibacillus polymyxa]|uniref:LytR/AlgR family response regulator transcription factor n=1 Tax=Paenibacillus polymyxa TaxID=1406 RepID=UPI0032AFF128